MDKDEFVEAVYSSADKIVVERDQISYLLDIIAEMATWMPPVLLEKVHRELRVGCTP